VLLELADGALADEFGASQAGLSGGLAAATTAALAAPMDYPALAQCTTPADRVALVLDATAPCLAEVAAAMVEGLTVAGVDPNAVTVLHSRAAAEDPCRLVPEAIRRRLTQSIHDPADRRQLAYLAASESGQPILIHRALHEADLVLPVGCLRAEGSAGYFGIHGLIFPTFSDAKTIERFRGLGSLDPKGERRRELSAEADHVAWLLGIHFTVQLVPAGGDGVLHVLAGESESVRRRGRTLYNAAWTCPAARRSNLVVAAIEGGGPQQTWENLGRALQAAEGFVEPDGAVALCCDLAESPGPAMQRLASAPSRAAALRQVNKDRPADALPAALLARALDHHKVYLLSRLDAPLVEELDMIPLADTAELCRLVQQHSSCTLLSNAPYATAENHVG